MRPGTTYIVKAYWQGSPTVIFDHWQGLIIHQPAAKDSKEHNGYMVSTIGYTPPPNIQALVVDASLMEQIKRLKEVTL